MIRIYGLRKVRMHNVGFVGGVQTMYSCATFLDVCVFYLKIQVIFRDLLGVMVIYPGELSEGYKYVFRPDLCYLLDDFVMKCKCIRKTRCCWSIV